MTSTIARYALCVLIPFFGSLATAQWTKTRGPYAGNVGWSAVTPTGTIIAAPSSLPVSVSHDQGLNWTPVTPFSGYDVKINDQRDIFVSGYPGRVWRSTDDGYSWSEILVSIDGYLLATGQNGLVLAAGSLGVQFSFDNGDTWVQRSRPTDGADGLAVDPVTGIVYLIRFQIFRSANNGMAWENINAPGGGRPLGMTWDHEGRMIVWGTNYLYTNNGSWISAMNGLPDEFLVSSLVVSQDNTLYCVAKTAPPGYLDARVYRSTNHGNSWQPIPDFPPANLKSGYTFNHITLDAGGRFFLSGGYGLLRSPEISGGRWAVLGVVPSPALTSEKPILIAGRDPNNVLCVSYVSLFRTTSGGASWEFSPRPGTDGYGLYSCVDANGRLIAHTRGLYRSTDQGASWDSLPGTPNSVVELASNAAGNIFLLESPSNGGIYRSVDYGDTWGFIRNNLNPSFRATTIASRSDSEVFLGGYEGSPYDTRIYRSTNNGDIWLPTAIPGALSNVSCFLFSPGGVVVAGTYGDAFYRSTNNGTTWHPIRTGLTDGRIVDMCRSPRGDFFAATHSGGVLRSTDEGITWFSYNDGLPDTEIAAIECDTTGTLFVLGATFGVYRSSPPYPDPPPQTIALDGIFSEPAYQLLATKLNNNLGFGPEADVTAIYRAIDSDYVYLGFECHVQATHNPFNSLPDGLAVFLDFPDRQGIPPGSPLGISTDQNYHYLNGLEEPANRRLNFDADMEVDYMLALYTNSTTSQVTLDAASHVVGSQVQVQTIASTDQRGSSVSGPSTGGVFPQDAVSYAFRQSEGAGSRLGFEVRIPRGQSAQPAGDIQIAASIVSAGAYFSDVTVPGNVTAGVLGFEPHFGSNRTATECSCGHPDSILGIPPYHTGSSLTTLGVQIAMGWNMVSVPLTVVDGAKDVVFPGSMSNAFRYAGGYVADSVLDNGVGYWLRFSSARIIQVTGVTRLADSISVQPGWNMIGPISERVAVSSITSEPPGMITSQFFGYAGGYVAFDTLRPGAGYWVRTLQAGTLYLSVPGQLFGRIAILPVSDQPPAPPEPAGVAEEGTAPATFALSQNFPNPFNPVTSIEFQLPAAGFAALKVYDILGREVGTLVNETMSPGVHTATWDASGMASGVYYCRLSFGGKLETRSMVVAR